MKYVLVSGGVISGIGKGVLASSTGLLLKTIGLKVSAIKIDPYLNIDAGTMSPLEHGECFVLNDGGEVDLDLGNYERFLNITLTRENNITTGKMYQHVLDRERRGDYLGKTVQIVSHLTDAIQDWIERVSRIPVDDTNDEPDLCIIELGGTIGDIESYPFMEAMRSLRLRAGKNNFSQIHVSLIPVVNGELKTKPTQHAVRDVRSGGLSPDLIACRCDQSLDRATISKLAHFCQVELGQVLAVPTVNSTYHVPLMLEQQGIITSLRDILRLDDLKISPLLIQRGQDIWRQWESLTTAQDRLYKDVTIVIVGKYANWTEAYLSVIKALEHAAMHCMRKLKKVFVNAEDLEPEMLKKSPANFHKAWTSVCTANGIIVPGGFGFRGTEGLIATAKWARENKTPYLGVCLGMQLAVIEFARNCCGTADATSGEFSEHAQHQIIINMPELDATKMGGTMRLGMRATHFQPGSEWSRLRHLYAPDTEHIMERHRHRYEVNPDYIEQLENSGMDFIGKGDSEKRMEIIELKDHPWFVGVQFHPEYLSKVLEPSMPYLGFIAASCGQLEGVTKQWQAKAAQPDGLAVGSRVMTDGIVTNGHV